MMIVFFPVIISIGGNFRSMCVLFSCDGNKEIEKKHIHVRTRTRTQIVKAMLEFVHTIR